MTNKHFLKKMAVVSVLGSTMLAASTSTLASYQAHAPGPLLTYGKTSNPSTILSIAGNPANGHTLLSEGEDHRMGYFSSLGFDYEVGEVDNFLDDVDELIDALDEDNLTINQANDIKAKFDALLPIMGEDAQVTLGLGLSVPFMPFAIKGDWLGGGVLSFDLKAQGLFDIRFLDAPLVIQTVGGNTTLETDSSMYVKGGSILTGSLGYSREVWKPTFVEGSKLYAGVQANIYKVSLNKQVIALSNIEDDEVSDAIRDEFDENTVDTTQIGLDLGLLWTMDSGQVGITFANINEPEFEYGDVGKNCGAITNPTRQANCFVAQNRFGNEINLSETAVMNAQTIVEGALFSDNKQWILSGAADINSVYDLVGRETQYISASASYFSDSYIIPSVRFGINKNLAGSKLTTVGFGTTLFGVMNVDVSTSLDTVEIDGTVAPRYFGFNIGFEEKF
jgi:hypothetical protein|tara:strand:- start:178 stop:1524 length:1347 start_codon:yes stop_codon:yes gene_type:complete